MGEAVAAGRKESLHEGISNKGASSQGDQGASSRVRATKGSGLYRGACMQGCTGGQAVPKAAKALQP